MLYVHPDVEIAVGVVRGKAGTRQTALGALAADSVGAFSPACRLASSHHHTAVTKRRSLSPRAVACLRVP